MAELEIVPNYTLHIQCRVISVVWSSFEKVLLLVVTGMNDTLQVSMIRRGGQTEHRRRCRVYLHSSVSCMWCTGGAAADGDIISQEENVCERKKNAQKRDIGEL